MEGETTVVNNLQVYFCKFSCTIISSQHFDFMSTFCLGILAYMSDLSRFIPLLLLSDVGFTNIFCV